MARLRKSRRPNTPNRVGGGGMDRSNVSNRHNFARGICPTGKTIGTVGWNTILRANELLGNNNAIGVGGNTGGGQSVYQDYNGDGRIDILDLIYFIQ